MCVGERAMSLLPVPALPTMTGSASHLLFRIFYHSIRKGTKTPLPMTPALLYAPCHPKVLLGLRTSLAQDPPLLSCYIPILAVTTRLYPVGLGEITLTPECE